MKTPEQLYFDVFRMSLLSRQHAREEKSKYYVINLLSTRLSIFENGGASDAVQ